MLNFSARLFGRHWEQRALQFLQQQNLRLVQQNYQCKGGEIDLIMKDKGGYIIFVEVRARTKNKFGSAAESVTYTKRQRLIRAAAHYLQQIASAPPCRFDVVTFDDGQFTWHRDAFSAGF